MGNAAPEKLLAAVRQVLSDPKYRKRVLEIKAEIATYDPISVIASAIDDLASR